MPKLTDETVVFGKNYYYYIEDVDFSGKTNKSHIIEVNKSHVTEVMVGKQGIKTRPIPLQFTLLQNFPNPFNPETWIPYNLPKDANVTISIYDTKGQLIRTITLVNQKAGVYTSKDRAAYWDGRDSLGQKVSSGVYYYTLQAGEFRSTRKMVIVK